MKKLIGKSIWYVIMTTSIFWYWWLAVAAVAFTATTPYYKQFLVFLLDPIVTYQGSYWWVALVIAALSGIGRLALGGIRVQ